MLDVLHISNAASVRCASAWDGGGRILAGRVDGEVSNSEGKMVVSDIQRRINMKKYLLLL